MYEELIGKVESEGSNLNLLYTNKGLDFDYYSPRPDPPQTILQPESLANVDTSKIEERAVNLCYCNYQLTYEIIGLTESPATVYVNSHRLK